jgi:GGDEF domain-containing protein
LRSPLSLEGTEIVVTASIGIALSRADSLEPDELLHSADLAMYQAKAGGGDAYLLAGSASHGRCDMQRAG